MSDIDTNISNYNFLELMSIIDMDPNNIMNGEEIIQKTNNLQNKFLNKNYELSVFFHKVQEKLLEYIYNKDSEEEDEEEERKEGFTSANVYSDTNTNNNSWLQNQNLQQSDTNQTNKITQRKQKVGIYDNDKNQMKQEQIATTDTYSLPVKQDSLNPNLKNTIKRFVNLDSQFRQYTSGVDSTATDYTCNLSDTLKDTLSMSIYSYQIPFSWYAIDSAYGNTCFWIIDSSTNNVIPISIPSGNYTATTFQTQLNTSFSIAGFTFPPYVSSVYNIPANSPVYYNTNNGIITMFLFDGSFNDPLGLLPSFTIDTTTSIVFFDFTGVLQCNNNCMSKNNSYLNNTLGWLMGYNLPYIMVAPDGNTAASILNLNGTKYLILVIDDYNQNHVNDNIVSISQNSNTLKIPTYYSTDIPYNCINAAQNSNNTNLQQLVDGVISQSMVDFQTTNASNGLLIAGKYNGDYTSTQIVLPSAPRTLTNAQIYTINEINKNNNNLTNYLAKPPTSADIFAILPVKTSVGVTTGSLLVEFSGSLQNIGRTYFGPVNIERMSIKLMDDKGNILNLNGNDWCITIVCECLYQY
jgi:hypothetical protein